MTQKQPFMTEHRMNSGLRGQNCAHGMGHYAPWSARNIDEECNKLSACVPMPADTTQLTGRCLLSLFLAYYSAYDEVHSHACAYGITCSPDWRRGTRITGVTTVALGQDPVQGLLPPTAKRGAGPWTRPTSELQVALRLVGRLCSCRTEWTVPEAQ
jgi:hypothetical protein